MRHEMGAGFQEVDFIRFQTAGLSTPSVWADYFELAGDS